MLSRLDIDARKAGIKFYKATRECPVFEGSSKIIARKSRDDAHSDRYHVKFVQQRGNVNAIAAARASACELVKPMCLVALRSQAQGSTNVIVQPRQFLHDELINMYCLV